MIFYLILSFLGCSNNMTPYKVHVSRVRQHANISKLSGALRPWCAMHEVKHITNHVVGNISIICSLMVSVLQIWGIYKDHKISFSKRWSEITSNRELAWSPWDVQTTSLSSQGRRWSFFSVFFKREQICVREGTIGGEIDLQNETRSVWGALLWKVGPVVTLLSQSVFE